MPEPAEVQCRYCRIWASIDTMRLPVSGGFACRDIPACDAREAAQAEEEPDG